MSENHSHDQRPQPGVDWGSLREALSPDDPTQQEEALQRLLQQRARQYARTPSQSAAEGAAALSLLLFRLAPNRYAVEAQAVYGVRPCPRVTRVPGAPPFYRGVVSVRGEIISVLDLRRFFQQEEAASAEPESGELVLVAGHGLRLALLADVVEDVMMTAAERIQPVDLPYTRGILGERTMVLELERLLADRRLMAGEANTYA